MSTLLQAISTDFTPLVEGSQATSSNTAQLTKEGLREDITKIWQTIPSLPSLDIPSIQEDPSSSDTQAGKKRQEKNVEIIRGSLEVYSREIVVEPTVRDTVNPPPPLTRRRVSLLIYQVTPRSWIFELGKR